MATYKTTRPWHETPQNPNYLELFQPRKVPSAKSDTAYEIESQYRHRPDLLANVLYDSPKLWWVFAQINPSTLKDPIFDFEPGLIIYIPNASVLKNTLGI
jgi:hypothetical protein